MCGASSSHCSCGKKARRKRAEMMRQDRVGSPRLPVKQSDHSPWAQSRQDICSNVSRNSSHKCPERATAVSTGVPMRASRRQPSGVSASLPVRGAPLGSPTVPPVPPWGAGGKPTLDESCGIWICSTFPFSLWAEQPVNGR